ncbi:Syntaxin-31 [Vitis vinifera]|uniref:Syntaxin-31 n=1 Tax=Vitis vinifera TaxID=29760 RepID=A0A438D5E1_VITVI|nr:Syntaxin-31 [Vitis vinifera]
MAAVSMGHHGPTIPIFHGLWPARRFFAWSRFLFVIDVYISPPPVTVTDYPLQFPMTSSGVSSYRDRTSEFRSLSERMKKIGGMAVANHAEDDPATSRSLASASSRSEFNKKASRIGLGIHEACLKISRLAKSISIAASKPSGLYRVRQLSRLRLTGVWIGVKISASITSSRCQSAIFWSCYFKKSDSLVAKKSSMFNDPIMEIQELTALIKDDITALNIAVSDLQTLQNLEIADGNYSDDRVVHSNTVCDDLKNKLMGATKQLQDVLTTRTENIKAHENRKQIFSTNVSRENPFQQHAKTVTEPPPWSSLSKTSGNLQPSVVVKWSSSWQPTEMCSDAMVTACIKPCQARRRLAVDNTPSNHMEVSMLQQVVPRQENYTQSRALALQNVESTISELSGIFTHLATMVAQQGELAIRIDDNMDESLANVEELTLAFLHGVSLLSLPSTTCLSGIGFSIMGSNYGAPYPGGKHLALIQI